MATAGQVWLMCLRLRCSALLPLMNDQTQGAETLPQKLQPEAGSIHYDSLTGAATVVARTSADGKLRHLLACLSSSNSSVRRSAAEAIVTLCRRAGGTDRSNPKQRSRGYQRLPVRCDKGTPQTFSTSHMAVLLAHPEWRSLSAEKGYTYLAHLLDGDPKKYSNMMLTTLFDYCREKNTALFFAGKIIAEYLDRREVWRRRTLTGFGA